MNVTSDHIAAVRALVTEDDDAFDLLTDNVADEWLDAFSRLITVTLFGGTKYRFGSGASREDLIRFVARSRIRRGGDKAGFSPSLAEALMAAAVGIAPSPAGTDEIENASAQIALLADLAGEISFRDFEALLAGARAKVNEMVPQADAEEGSAQYGSSPAQVAGILSPGDVLAAVERVRVQGDATASRVNELEAQVRELRAQVESSVRRASEFR